MRVMLAALMVVSVAPAQSAEKESWGFVRSGKEAHLVYGVPETEIVTLSFICEGKRIEIISTVLPRRPRKGQAARTALTNGAVTASYDGKFGSSNEGFYFQAYTAAEPKVVEVLRSGTALTISIPGKQERVPLRGVSKPLNQFEATCFR